MDTELRAKALIYKREMKKTSFICSLSFWMCPIITALVQLQVRPTHELTLIHNPKWSSGLKSQLGKLTAALRRWLRKQFIHELLNLSGSTQIWCKTVLHKEAHPVRMQTLYYLAAWAPVNPDVTKYVQTSLFIGITSYHNALKMWTSLGISFGRAVEQ